MKFKKIFSGVIAIAAIAASSSTIASKTSLQSFDDMVHDASACVVAEVASSSSAASNGGVSTYTKFDVQSVAFGDVGKTITVQTSGGQLPNTKIKMREVSASAPLFLPGQKVMMLLEKVNGAETFRVVGVNQGIFNIANDGSVNMSPSKRMSANEMLKQARQQKSVLK